MTIRSDQNIVYKSMEDRIAAARTELGMAGDIACQIYQSRQSEPDESQLIKNFYYSIYHLVKGISIIDTGKEYHSHHALISYFNRESRKSCFLNGTVQLDDTFRSDLTWIDCLSCVTSMIIKSGLLMRRIIRRRKSCGKKCILNWKMS